MAKKRARERTASTAVPGGSKRNPAKKAATTKKPIKRRSSKKSAKKSTGKKSTGKQSTARKKTPAKTGRAARKKKVSLGRPQVTGEEKLYLLFKEDFHARQVFAFLNVETVRELEEYSAKEIVKQLSRPIRKTVDRIRRHLAEKNRYLLDDEEFARLHKADRK